MIQKMTLFACFFGLGQWAFSQTPCPTAASSTILSDTDLINQNTLDHFIGWTNTNGMAPSSPLEKYNMMSGRWRDGLPISPAGSGHDPASSAKTDWLFDGDPTDPNAWSMASAGLLPSDQKALGTTFVGRLDPGAVYGFNAAWSRRLFLQTSRASISRHWRLRLRFAKTPNNS